LLSSGSMKMKKTQTNHTYPKQLKIFSELSRGKGPEPSPPGEKRGFAEDASIVKKKAIFRSKNRRAMKKPPKGGNNFISTANLLSGRGGGGCVDNKCKEREKPTSILRPSGAAAMIISNSRKREEGRGELLVRMITIIYTLQKKKRGREEDAWAHLLAGVQEGKRRGFT